MLDELTAEELTELVAKNVPRDAHEFFTHYAREFCEGLPIDKSIARAPAESDAARLSAARARRAAARRARRIVRRLSQWSASTASGRRRRSARIPRRSRTRAGCSPRGRSRSTRARASSSPGDIEAQTERVIANLAAVLEAAGSSLARVVKTTVYVTDLALFARINAVYARHFTGDPFRPRARRCRWPRCRSAPRSRSTRSRLPADRPASTATESAAGSRALIAGVRGDRRHEVAGRLEERAEQAARERARSRSTARARGAARSARARTATLAAEPAQARLERAAKERLLGEAGQRRERRALDERERAERRARARARARRPSGCAR